ncbi:hypothetical protein CY35_09G075800 [Sphagnum magellanicum]|nr:hypothetical protein CY35_09G075800 [Sphagnum magellanicum]KAH9552618.1 hypothetical protein CY35_09G075800 [Sphagnum magellanicum]KAH9552619.1 hypothetical protein CY35_09G075800 [Sphagnum magellanicum]
MTPRGCLICAPLVARSVSQMLTQMQEAKANGADVVESRVDHIPGFNAAKDLPVLLNARTLPMIVTARAKWEGGVYEGEETERQKLLQLAVKLGADYVDIELQVARDFIATLKQNKIVSETKVIVSNHNWEVTPSLQEIGELVARIQSTGADIVKFATTATNITDVSRVLHLLAHSQVPTIALVMGPKGVIGRILCPKYGGYLTFGALSKGQESAPGQPTLADLSHVYRVGQVGRDTKVFGIIGNPVYHSKSPILHNAAFEKCGIDAVYVPFLVEDLAEFLSVYSVPDFSGFSVTIPHKEAALKCCDEVDPIAKAIGAVNTIVRKSDGKLVGYNTDCDGALTAIEDGLHESGLASEGASSPLKGKLFVVIGAGGAGKALAFGARERGARVVIANRNFGRAKELAAAVGGEAIQLEKLSEFRPETGMVLANSTSIGMQPDIDQSPIPKDALSAYCLVFDAVYTPRTTKLLREAAEVGAAVVSGMEMFIRQAYGQFELFTGQPAPKELMREIVMAAY